MEDALTLPLRKPIEFAGKTFSELSLREPTAGELEKAANATNNMGMVITLVSLVAGVPRKVAESLSQRDLKAAGDFFDRFSASEDESSESSSPT